MEEDDRISIETDQPHRSVGASPLRSEPPKRLGVLLCASKINTEAARFLVLAMNQEQDAFEYEFLPIDAGDEFLIPFCSNSALDHTAVRNDIVPFLSRFDAYLRGQAAYFGLQEGPPDYFVLISTATFTNNYYSLREGRLGIIALGNWKRFMAPPSLLEFVLTLLIRESVGAMSPSLRAPVHLGTKGCLLDFTPSLQDVAGRSSTDSSVRTAGQPSQRKDCPTSRCSWSDCFARNG